MTRVPLVLGLVATVAAGLSAQNLPPLDAEKTPLHWAAEHGLYSVAEQLIKNGAVVDAPDEFGRTPLFLAVAYPDIVTLLLSSGASVNTSDIFGRTPLHVALLFPATVSLLLDAGASVQAEDFLGHTPLERATRFTPGWRSLDVITLLLAAGAGAPRASP